MTLESLLTLLSKQPDKVDFAEVIALIDGLYHFAPTAFRNGDVYNEAGQNNGSCKIFAFAKLQDLDKARTLACFGDYYRVDVLGKPMATDHANIRNFIKYGWSAVEFKDDALTAK